MNLMDIALKNNIRWTPNGPYLYPYSVRGRKPFSLLTDDESSDGSLNSSGEDDNLGMGAKIKCIYDNDLYKHDSEVEDECSVEQGKRVQETMYEYKSRREGEEVEYISREDVFEIQYAKDFEFFFGVPYRPYIRLSRYRFGKNMKYPRDLKQEEAVYKKYPRYFFNDPWPDIDVSKPIPYVKQKQPPKLVNERGVPIVWLDVIEKSKRYNVRRGNKSAHNLESHSRKEPPRTLGDAVVAWEVSSSLLNGDLPSIIGEDKRNRKQKRFSFVRDNIRGVAEEIESWTKCPVVQTEINKYLDNSWTNIEKQFNSKPNDDHSEKKPTRQNSLKDNQSSESTSKASPDSNKDLKSAPNDKTKASTNEKPSANIKVDGKAPPPSSATTKGPPSASDGPPKGPPKGPSSTSDGPPKGPPKGPPSTSDGPPKGPTTLDPPTSVVGPNG
ncbi:hypothetical protein OJ253_2768, partial [Cryptosporidium canis]